MDILIVNARIWRSGLQYSLDKQQFYSWMLFNTKAGKIKLCGSGNDPPPKCEVEDLKILDLEGKWVLPGFHDSHIHILWHGMFSNKFTNLGIPNSIKEIQEKLKVMLREPYNVPEERNRWFVGIGFEQGAIGRNPTSADLDEVDTTRPLMIYHTSLHIAVLNSLAMKMVGYDGRNKIISDEVDVYPTGHKMEGKPSGILRESALNDAVKLIPRSTNHIKKCIQSALNDCVKLGITSVHCLDADSWKEYVQLAEEEKLSIQCFFSVYCMDLKRENKPRKAGETPSPMLKCSCVKIFADGALGSDTAALSKPYKKKFKGDKDNYGILYYSQEELEKMVKEVDGQGFQLEIHVIGDQAAESAVIALEKADITPDKRPIFVHCQVLRRDLIKRMAKIGVIAAIQPQSVPADARWAREKLPDELQECMYPYRSLLEAGVICAGSSDSPAYYPNSLMGIRDAIFQPENTAGQQLSQTLIGGAKGLGCFQPRERVSFSQAVDMYTAEAAKIDFAENVIGRLEPGFFANFVVLEIPFTGGNVTDISLHPEVLADTKVGQTWAQGVKLYDMYEGAM